MYVVLLNDVIIYTFRNKRYKSKHYHLNNTIGSKFLKYFYDKINIKEKSHTIYRI